MVREVILWMGSHFSPEQYLFWTRVQCVAWTSADLVIVFYILRIANLGRCVLKVRPHRWSYVVLAITAGGIPFIAAAGTGWRIFLLELLITVPHFLIILYVAAADFRRFPLALNALLHQQDI